MPWRSGRARSLRGAPSQEAFEAMLPVLIDSFGQSDDPMRAHEVRSFASRLALASSLAFPRTSLSSCTKRL